jgi:hypothetical protein
VKYDVHPAVEMIRKWVAALPEKTGRSLPEWGDLFAKESKAVPVRRDLVARFVKDYGLGRMTAEQIYEYQFGRQTWDGEARIYLKNAAEYVRVLFAGPKAHFLPLFETVVDYARGLGKDVKVCPCKTIVPLYRHRVFAEMRPATKARFDLALCLVDVPFEGSLIRNARAKGNDRQTHLVSMESLKDFTPAVKKWLKLAYAQDSKS